jgi:hypothetical protein
MNDSPNVCKFSGYPILRQSMSNHIVLSILSDIA